MRIPCTVYILESDALGHTFRHPVFSTRTYWGAKRIEKRIKKVKPQVVVSIHEVWNIPQPGQTEPVIWGRSVAG